MRTKLNDIASIQTGVFAKTTSTGDVVYLKARHFDENGRLSKALHPDLKLNYKTQKHLLKPDDIIFAAKGTKNFAAWYEGKHPLVVASTSFFIIRLDNSGRNKVLPPYLVWYLNHPSTQKYLKGYARGTNIVSIAKDVLEDLEVPVPEFHIQEAVIKINDLRNREKKLKENIEELREKLIQQQILNGIK